MAKNRAVGYLGLYEREPDFFAILTRAKNRKF